MLEEERRINIAYLNWKRQLLLEAAAADDDESVASSIQRERTKEWVDKNEDVNESNAQSRIQRRSYRLSPSSMQLTSFSTTDQTHANLRLIIRRWINPRRGRHMHLQPNTLSENVTRRPAQQCSSASDRQNVENLLLHQPTITIFVQFTDNAPTQDLATPHRNLSVNFPMNPLESSRFLSAQQPVFTLSTACPATSGATTFNN